MTIAACYLSPEGLVLGADSTTTYMLGAPFMGGREKHYNHGQKIFEIGEGGSLAVVTWGLGGLAGISYRTLIAQLADFLESAPPASVLEVAERWAAHFWAAYTLALANEIQVLKDLARKSPPNPNTPLVGDANTRSLGEEFYLAQNSQQLVVGFCIGGYVRPDRKPAAFELIIDPLLGCPSPTVLPPAQTFWGVPALVNRLINGCADEVVGAIMQSGKWGGTREELNGIIRPHKLAHPTTVPIREAIDFTHACLLTTIKAMKFSNLPQVCGGPIELAVVTTDRKFRWVRHKNWQTAILEGGHEG